MWSDWVQFVIQLAFVLALWQKVLSLFVTDTFSSLVLALQIRLYAIKCLSSVWNIKYGNIHCMANLVAGLVSYYDDVGIHVVDAALEDIRAGMEVCDLIS